MKSEEYTNRYGDTFTFTPSDIDDNVILWTGNFEYCRWSLNEDDDTKLTMVDPSGGPYISENTPSHLVHSKILNKKINYMEFLDEKTVKITLK